MIWPIEWISEEEMMKRFPNKQGEIKMGKPVQRRLYLIVDINNFTDNEKLSDRIRTALKKYCSLDHESMGRSSIAQIGNDIFYDVMTFDDEREFDELNEKIKSLLVQHIENDQTTSR